MIALTVDGRSVTVPEGATLLDAARAAGAAVPTLCHLAGRPPHTGCMVCVVEDPDAGRLLPSCSAAAAPGQRIRTASETVLAARREVLELLLAEHVGDCEGPCQRVLPLPAPVPPILRAVAAGEWSRAAGLLGRLPLPRTAAWLCPAGPEKACRRARHDAAVGIRAVLRSAAACLEPGLLPRPAAESGRAVAVLGAGPAGLAATAVLRRCGHAVTLFDRREEAGGELLALAEGDPRGAEALAADRRNLDALGVTWRLGEAVATGPEGLRDLRSCFAAVLLAGGRSLRQAAPGGGPDGSLPGRAEEGSEAAGGLFAAGSAAAEQRTRLHSLADGRRVALAMDRYLRGAKPAAPPASFQSTLGALQEGELAIFLAEAENRDPRVAAPEPGPPLTAEEARREAARCLHCDCRAAADCALRRAAEDAGARQRRPAGGRAAVRVDRSHPTILFEPGKCIRCSRCVRLCAEAGEPWGLTEIHRGHETVIAPPLGRRLAEALTVAGSACVEACPTGALAWKQKPEAQP